MNRSGLQMLDVAHSRIRKYNAAVNIGRLVSSLLGILAFSQPTVGLSAHAQPVARPNVLLILVDDLRPELGVYGASGAHTPNLDALARRGARFSHAYTQQALCSPSRTSLLTGRRPDTTRIYDLETHFRETIPDVVTLPQYFKQNGWNARSIGKVYHQKLDDPPSWSAPSRMPKAQIYGPTTQAILTQAKRFNPNARGPSWKSVAVPDESLPDGETAQGAILLLRELADQPFFLAIGFIKPHLPFVAPRKYFDLHPPATVRLARSPLPPAGTSTIALHDSGELRDYEDIPAVGPISATKALELIRAYRAATSYTDAMIGRVLAELDRLHLRERTIVIVWGDNGYHLGDNGLWAKHTNFEVATRIPLLISAPGYKPDLQIDGFAETVDLYPTLCDLAGLPIPRELEGESLKPMLSGRKVIVKDAAFSQYPRGTAMGYSIRTRRFRYTEWLETSPDGKHKPIAIEFYDHQTDPHESINRAGDPEYGVLLARHSKQLAAGWKGARQKIVSRGSD